MDARWTKKGQRSYFGYKNHINIDREFKFIRKWIVSPASLHDSRAFKDIYNHNDTNSPGYGDGAYFSQEIELFINNCGGESKIRLRKKPNKNLDIVKEKFNKINSIIRISVEHVFAKQKACMKLFIRTIGLKRAKLKIGLANLVYNFSRFEFLLGTV